MTTAKTFVPRATDALAQLKREIAKLCEPVPGSVWEVHLCGRAWATCISPRTKPGEDGRWLQPLPGIVALCNAEGLLDARATDDVRGTVQLWRAAGAYNARGFRLVWTYCTGVEQLRAFEGVVLKIAGRQVADVARRIRQDEVFRRLERQVRALAVQVA